MPRAHLSLPRCSTTVDRQLRKVFISDELRGKQKSRHYLKENIVTWDKNCPFASDVPITTRVRSLSWFDDSPTFQCPFCG